jgi:tetratricopeptide (TPR) repeat protein
MQVGPAPAEAPVSSLPPEIQDRRAMRNPSPAPRVAPALLTDCLALIRADPAAALEFVAARRPGAQGLAAAHLDHCRGVALAATGAYAEAAEAFIAAREAVGADQATYRARLGAMAGNAALAAGDPEGALGALDQATADAGGKGSLAGEIALDSARALVALGQTDEAAGALAAARDALPYDAQAWLLSATLARRTGDLTTAQAQIQRAAEIDPRNRQIGLEAGVIAMLAGREEAARKSWQSVIDASPESPEANDARGYIAQLDAPAGGSR